MHKQRIPIATGCCFILLLTACPLTTTAARSTASCCQVHLGDTPHNLTEADFEVLARQTDGFSGSDISVCVSEGREGGRVDWQGCFRSCEVEWFGACFRASLSA